MSDPKSAIKDLLEKYLNNDCTDEEKAIVENWYLSLNKEIPKIEEKEVLKDLSDLHSRLSNITGKKINYVGIIKYSAAAVLFLVAFISIWILNKPGSSTNKTYTQSIEIEPGNNKATLVLDGESPIELSGNQNGLMNKGGIISYEDGTIIKVGQKVQMATLKTPVAGQYKLELLDGTKVWLNAQSSVQYPTQFDKKYREIYITGEVFLEVAKNPKQPFIVRTKSQRIEVLGTSFNIDSHADDGNVYVSLNEGRLKVSSADDINNVVLNPGQQAIIEKNDNITVNEINADEISSWKDGLYIINDEPLDHYLNKIERWYDIEFERSNINQIKLSAIIPRNAKLSEVLESIEVKTGVKFKIEGRRVRVN